MNRVRVGVIGIGGMGQRHCRVYSSLRGTQLIGVCDANREAGSRVAQQYDVPFYSDLCDLLERVEAVSIAVPTPLHFDLAMHCLDRGVHALVEKPMTETLEQAERLVRAAQESGLILLVGHIERFNPAYTELKNVLAEMTPLALNLTRLSPYERSNHDVDVVLDLMIHDIDLALDFLSAEPALVGAHGLCTSDSIDYALAILAVDRGPLVTLTASRVTEQKIRSIEVTALEAYLECDLLEKRISVHHRTVGEYLDRDRPGVKYRQESIVQRIQVPGYEPLALELEHFVNCIVHKDVPLVPASTGLAALRMACCIRSAIEARRTDLDVGERRQLMKSLLPRTVLAPLPA